MNTNRNCHKSNLTECLIEDVSMKLFLALAELIALLLNFLKLLEEV